MGQSFNERRLGDRRRVKIEVHLEAGDSLIATGHIIDLSTTGARLELNWGEALPHFFTLKTRDTIVQAELVWRSGFDAGVRFVVHDEDQVRTTAPLPAAAKLSLSELRALARLNGK